MPLSKFYLLSFFPLLIIIGSCQQQSSGSSEKSEKANNLVIAGKIKNPKKSEIGLKKMPNGEKKTYQVNDKGEFKGLYPLSEPAYFKFTHKESTNSFAGPGDSIYMTLNTKQFNKSLEYSGTNAAVNQYLARKFVLGDSVHLIESRQDMQNLYSKSPREFTNVIDSVHNTYKQHLKDYFKEQSSGQPFKQYERANLALKFNYRKFRYPDFYSRLNDGKKPDLSDQFYAFTDDIELDDSYLLKLPKFMPYVYFYNRHKQAAVLEKDSSLADTTESILYKTIVKNHVPNDTIKAHLVGSRIQSSIDKRKVEKMKPLLTYYKQLPYQDNQKAEIDTLIAKRKAISPGNEAPGFTYPSIKGDTVSLADLKGSYVYIDVWATWCGPCIKEIPHLKELHDDLKDENIKFVSISVDDAEDKGKWEKMVDEKSLKGIQLFAGQDEKLSEDYMVSSIPRFILIGPDGKIIDPNAERPSQDIKSRLESLLEEKEA